MILFDFITNHGDGSPRSYRRRLFRSNSRIKDSWTTPVDCSTIPPDFTLADEEDLNATQVSEKSGLPWRMRLAFAKISATDRGLLKLDDPELPNIVTHSADLARLHLSAKPFQLFSVGILISGDLFCVAIYDRVGVTFSPVCNLWGDTELFIRIVRRLTWDLLPSS